MKAGIHPTYEDCTIICACGNVVKTKSTNGGEMKVEICSKCPVSAIAASISASASAMVSSE